MWQRETIFTTVENASILLRMVEPPSVKFSANYHNGPLWRNFFWRKKLKIQNDTILDISLKNVCAKFGWSRARNKKKLSY